MTPSYVIGIDLGGTNVRAGKVSQAGLGSTRSARINGAGSVEEVLNDLMGVMDGLLGPGVQGIGVGVPSVVDIDEGIVYEVQNIPSWKEVPLKKILEDKYGIPVEVNNDANCFALGEYYFGKGKGKDNMIGLIVGTGLGAGIIINRKLYAGANCGAGEFGLVNYLDKYFEYYACGQFFQNVYQVDGQMVYEKALQGDREALQWYEQLGIHLGQAIKMILYTYDMDQIILGGSVRKAYCFFEKTMWEQIHTLAYSRTAQRLRISLSELEHGGLLGAAALCYNAGITSTPS